MLLVFKTWYFCCLVPGDVECQTLQSKCFNLSFTQKIASMNCRFKIKLRERDSNRRLNYYYICIYIYIYIYIYICMYMCVCVSVCVSVRVWLLLSSVWRCTYISLHICMYVCMRAYIYIYIYIYISSSPSCHAAGIDIPDPLSPFLPIVHRLWQVFRASSRILT